jgi:sugar phosphate isomerase/epimerase
MAFTLGIIIPLSKEDNLFVQVAELGFKTCQLQCWNPELYTEELAKQVKQQSRDIEINLASLWAGWSGPAVWDFMDGPLTLGLVPCEWRLQRVNELKKGADFARSVNAPAIITHLGFIPENPNDPVYKLLVEAVKDVADYCLKLNLNFWFESGQETPVTLLRLIEDLNMPNVGINFDTANLILYGKANPCDALDVFGRHVRSLHAKDGLYPTNGRKLGEEVPLGLGKANMPEIIKKLSELGFTGEIIIEREITGEQQKIDMIKARDYLLSIL